VTSERTLIKQRDAYRNLAVKIIDAHEQVRLDTPQDQALHDECVALSRRLLTLIDSLA